MSSNGADVGGGGGGDSAVQKPGGVKAMLAQLNSKYSDSHVQLPDGTIPTGKVNVPLSSRGRNGRNLGKDEKSGEGSGEGGADGGVAGADQAGIAIECRVTLESRGLESTSTSAIELLEKE